MRGATRPGALAADGHLRLEVSQLLPSSTFHIDYEASYVDPAERGKLVPSGRPTPKTGRLWLLSLGDTPTLADYSGTFQMKDAVRVTENVVELRLRLVEPLETPDGRPLELDALTCKVRHDVYSDGDSTKQGEDASLLVPTTKAGKKWVKAKVVEAGAVRAADKLAARSYDSETWFKDTE